MPLCKISLDNVSSAYFRSGLGAGAAGSVQELTRKDGTKVVFKGEIESRSGLAGIVAGMGAVYGDAQKVVSLNLAANHAAEGKVLDAADWLDAHDEPLDRGQIRSPRTNGRPAALDHAWSDKTHFLVCPSYFTRDYFDRLFG